LELKKASQQKAGRIHIRADSEIRIRISISEFVKQLKEAKGKQKQLEFEDLKQKKSAARKQQQKAG